MQRASTTHNTASPFVLHFARLAVSNLAPKHNGVVVVVALHVSGDGDLFVIPLASITSGKSHEELLLRGHSLLTALHTLAWNKYMGS